MSYFIDEREQRAREQKIETIMRDWNLYNAFYRTGIIEYRFLYNALKEQKRTGLRKISESHLREFPKVRILDIPDEDLALEILLFSSDLELSIISYELEQFKFNYTANTLRDLLKEYRYKIDHANNPQGISEPAFFRIRNSKPNRNFR